MDIGKTLIFIGLTITAFGIIFLFMNQFSWFSNLPGNFKYESKNFRIYAPIASMLIISILASIIFNLFIKFFK